MANRLRATLAERLGDSLERLYGDEVEAMFDYARKSGESGIPPSRVALAVEHALTSQKPKTRYLVGTDARIQALIARFVPDRWKDKLVLQQLGTPRHK